MAKSLTLSAKSNVMIALAPWSASVALKMVTRSSGQEKISYVSFQTRYNYICFPSSELDLGFSGKFSIVLFKQPFQQFSLLLRIEFLWMYECMNEWIKELDIYLPNIRLKPDV